MPYQVNTATKVASKGNPEHPSNNLPNVAKYSPSPKNDEGEDHIDIEDIFGSSSPYDNRHGHMVMCTPYFSSVSLWISFLGCGQQLSTPRPNVIQISAPTSFRIEAKTATRREKRTAHHIRIRKNVAYSFSNLNSGCSVSGY